MVRPLDEPGRRTPTESLPNKKQSSQVSKNHAARTRRKKSPAQPTIAALLENWADGTRLPNNKIVADHVSRAIGHLRPAQINSLMLGAIVATWRKNLRPSSAYLYRAKLNEIMRMLAQFGAPPIRAPKVPRPSNRATVATGDELHRLITKAQPYMRLFILLYLQCGLRFSEAMAVTPRSWNPEQHCVTVRVKGGNIRTAQITDDVERLLLSALNPEPDEPFIQHLRGKILSRSGLRMAWNRHRSACGVNPKLTAHDLRRTSATILYTTTKDLRIAQQLLGHKNLASTLSYLAPLAPEEARRYAELLRFDNFHPREGEQKN